MASEVRALDTALDLWGLGGGGRGELFNSSQGSCKASKPEMASQGFTFKCLDGGQGECFLLLKLIPYLIPGCFKVQLHDLLDVISYRDFQIFQLGRCRGALGTQL